MYRGASLLPVLAVVAAAAAGVASGVGAYTFIYAEGASYLTDDPAACNNCHVMNDHYAAWRKSSHHAVATCNDCHTPPTFPAKYVAKGLNGYHHSLAFTTGVHPEPLRITERNRVVTEAQCRHCHGEIVAQIEGPHAGRDELSCLRCHPTVGHLE
jgi:cytochrome c nitrite reductase small subunit